MNASALLRLQRNLSYSFKNIELLEQALTHRSFSSKHYERLEFLGDSIVNAVAAQLLYENFSSATEGHLSSMRSALVRRETLAEIAVDLKIGEHLTLGGGTSKSGGHRLDSLLSDAFEAIVGAVFLDGGWQSSYDAVAGHFIQRIENMGDLREIRDAKSQLQEWLQARGHPLPKYLTIAVAGPGHAQKFTVECSTEALSGRFEGQASSRRAAEQQAASLALASIEAQSDRK